MEVDSRVVSVGAWANRPDLMKNGSFVLVHIGGGVLFRTLIGTPQIVWGSPKQRHTHIAAHWIPVPSHSANVYPSLGAPV